MAKIKSSKFSKVLGEIRQSNEQSGVVISDLQKNVSEIENTVLLIMEKIRRMERYPIVKTKGGKLIPPKVGADKTLTAANDSLNDETSRDILVKLYNFMVRNSQKEKDEEKVQRQQKKSDENQKQVDFRKQMIRSGLDPKHLKKKKGLLSKIGTGVKWGIFGALGLGLMALVTMFKEEIVSAAKSISGSIQSFGNFLITEFRNIKNVISPFVDLVLKNPLVQMLKSKVEKLYDDISKGTDSILNTIDLRIESALTGAYDSIVNWISGAFKPLTDWLKSPSFSWQGMKDVLYGVGMALLSGPQKVAISARAIETGVDAGEEMRLKGVYGSEYYDKTKDILDKYSDEQLELLFNQQFGGRFKNFFVGKLDRRELLNAVVRDHMEHKLLAQPLEGDNEANVKRRKEVQSMIKDRDKKFLDDMQQVINNAFPDRGYVAQYNDQGGYAVYDMTKKPGDQGYTVLDLDQSTMEYMRLRGKKETLNFIKKKLEDANTYLKSTSLYQAGAATAEQAKTAIKDSEDSMKRFKEEGLARKDQAISSVQSAYSGATTPEQKMWRTGELASKGVDTLNQKVIAPATKAASGIDPSALFDAYNKMGESIGAFTGSVSQMNSWDKMSEFFNKLNPEQRNNNIQQDPNDDPFNMESMWKQAASATTPSNTVYNNKTSTSGMDNFAFPPVRNNDPSKQWCVIDSLCKP
jgi:hypothetical protein